MFFRRIFAPVVIAAVFLTPASAEISLNSLLDEMTRLERLTSVPVPFYTTKQFSSYDRKSTDPSIQSIDNWFANADFGQFIREDKRGDEIEYVMMEAEGPGAIVRMWSADPYSAGCVRVYIDGAATPVIDMPFTSWLGGAHPLTPEPIGGTRAAGWNCYLPVPYSESIRVVATKPGFYYLINYRTYEAGTVVQSFCMADAESLKSKIDAVAASLAQPRQCAVIPPGSRVEDKRATVGFEDTSVFEFNDGPGAVYRLTGRIDADDVEAALRGTWLEIAFDGRTSVQTPLGDFFGTGPGPNPFESVPCGMDRDGAFYSHWVMPYRERFEIRLTGHSRQEAHVELAVTTAPRQWTDACLYFHAKYRGELQIPTRPFQDWNYLCVTGRGRFAGTSLHIVNPVANWWGEGDEKIYVDGEAFPSHFGTGTEDYFGYAWCSPELFTHAYHNQPRCDGPGKYGHTNVNRFHIIDDIPFLESFRFDMEVWHLEETIIDQFVTTYWYADGQSADNTPPIDPELLRIRELPEFVPWRAEGVLEAEDFELESITGGEDRVQESFGWPWSNGKQRWWISAAPGDALTLIFPAETDGLYEVKGRFTKAPDYAVARFAINGTPAGDEIDFYDSTVTVADEISLGTHNLVAGNNTLTATIVGRNPAAVPGYMVGIDYVRLIPAGP